MRPPAERQSSLRAPLNRVLGTEANVRILRVLCEAKTPLGKGEVARRAQLNPSGVRRALADLIACGVVENVGVPARQPVRMRKDHSLVSALGDLFQAERERVDGVLESLRQGVASLRPPPMSAWIQGAVARGCDGLHDPLVLGILTSATYAASHRSQLQSLMHELLSDPDVVVEPRVFTLADLESSATIAQDLENIVLLVAPHPLQLLEARRAELPALLRRSHLDRDRQSLELARAIAERIAADPGLIPRAVDRLKQRLAHASPGERHELKEWLDLLENRSAAQVGRLLVDHGERAARLRQSLPFLDVLSESERAELLARSAGPVPE